MTANHELSTEEKGWNVIIKLHEHPDTVLHTYLMKP